MKNYALKLGVPEDRIIAWIPDVEVGIRGKKAASLELYIRTKSKNAFL